MGFFPAESQNLKYYMLFIKNPLSTKKKMPNFAPNSLKTN
jgi:hypothetical protein